MFDDENLTSEILSDPGRLQYKVLEELSNRTDGKFVPSDPNNGMFSALEASSSMVSQLYRNMIREFESGYPYRATTPEDLYKHMSDFDYIHMTANPASLSFRFILDRNEIASRSEVFNVDYKKLVIPKDTIIFLGDRPFSLFYPIEIRTNIRTGNMIVTYDTSELNPLHSLSTNLVPYQTFTTQGLDLISIDILAHQFLRETHIETTTPQQGFNVSYAYTNRFMAARVYHKRNGSWQELSYTLSENIYDRDHPTAKITPLSNIGRIKISIPQIYFTQGLVSNEIRVQIFTTEGELNLPITTEDVNNITANFGLREDTDNTYSSMLTALTFQHMLPNQKLIKGGRNEITFNDLKERVIYGSTFKTDPITAIDIGKFVEDNGFKLTKYLDNVTSRIYYANKTMVDADNRSVPITIGQIHLTSNIVDTTQTLLKHDDDSVVILPTTLYKYSESSEICTPLDDLTRSSLEALTKEALAAELNTNTYTRNPFHIVVYRDDKYPFSKTFNLNTPEVTNVLFVEENVQAIPQMTITDAKMVHLSSGTGGYTLRLGIKSVGFDLIDREDVTILISTKDRNSNTAYLQASYVQSFPDMDEYEVVLPTNYRITKDGYIRTSMIHDGEGVTITDILLDTEFNVFFLVDSYVLPSTAQGFSLPDVPADFADKTLLVHQKITISFGKDLSTAIFNITDALWSQEEYVTWPEDVYHTYQEDVYELDGDGSLKVDVIPNPDYDDQDPNSKPNLLKTYLLHSKGDIILNSEGQPTLKHAEDSIKYERDSEGNLAPVIFKNREIVYFIESFMLDARLYASSSPSDITYLASISEEINAYVDQVKEMNGALIDRTEMYFKPVRTIGSADFSLGNELTVRMSLGLGFKIVYYVTRAVNVDDALKTSMINTTERIIEEKMSKKTISLQDMSEELKAALKDNIESIDSLGINGVTTTQTLFVKDNDISPMVGRKLTLNQDGSLSLKRDITVEWKLAE
jgi:hypothetical protein